jgi:starch-binding outer membrane protein, SusD/RagB family
MYLLCTGRALTVVNTFGTAIRQELPWLASDAYVIDNHHLLFPIPQVDVGLDPSLTQNPCY